MNVGFRKKIGLVGDKREMKKNQFQLPIIYCGLYEGTTIQCTHPEEGSDCRYCVRLAHWETWKRTLILDVEE